MGTIKKSENKAGMPELRSYTRHAYAVMLFFIILLSVYTFSHSTCAAGLVPCTNDCNLCYLLVGISNIFQYLTGALLTTAFLLGITIAGLSYMVSGAFPKVLTFAKSAFTNSLKGFVLALIAWIIINGIMNIVGYKNPQGGTWYQFECSGNANTQTANTKCDSKNKKLESITIQCAEQKETLTDSGSGFFVALDTLSEDEKGKTKQLKAVAKYSCDGTTSEEDITAQAEWKASDETQIKVAKGLVQAVTKSLGSSGNIPYVEAKFQEKNSNQAKVYINSCPNTETADAETKNKISFSENSLTIPKANAQTWNCPNCGKSDAPGTKTCASCGHINTCPFVYGNKNAKYIFVISKLNSTGTCSSYPYGRAPFVMEKWDNFRNKAENKDDGDFIAAAEKLAKGLDVLPGGIENFAVYRTEYVADRRGEKDSSCPKAQFVNYGYMCKSKMRAFASREEGAVYSFRDIDSTILAHEQIGHAFARLDDEYEECKESDPDNPLRSHYNCTSKNNLTPTYDKGLLWNTLKGYKTKWGEMSIKDVQPGCFYTKEYYRSSVNSIMRDNAKAKGFEWVNEKVIDYTIKHFPDGPDEWSWGESLKAQCSVK